MTLRPRYLFKVAGSYAFLWMFAAACGALPFYVHLHPDRFHPPMMHFDGFSESQLNDIEIGQARTATALLRPKLMLDQITTGSIPTQSPKTGGRVGNSPDREFRGKTQAPEETVQFITASKDRALALVSGKLTILSTGDRLPDGRVISGFTSKDGKITPLAEDLPVAREN